MTHMMPGLRSVGQRSPPPGYDDVVYRVHPSALTVVTRSAAALKSRSERVMIRPYPPPTLAAVA